LWGFGDEFGGFAYGGCRDVLRRSGAVLAGSGWQSWVISVEHFPRMASSRYSISILERNFQIDG